MQLSESIPEVAAEIAEGLTLEGRTDLALQVAVLQIVDRCRCGDSFCASFATEAVGFRPETAERVIVPMRGLICLLAVEGRLVYVELVNRPEIRARLLELLP